MKKVLIDANVFNVDNITNLINSNAIKKVNKEYELYVSGVLFKQTLAHLCQQGYKGDYEFLVDFINKYCSEKLVDDSKNIVIKELFTGFKECDVFSHLFTKKDIKSFDSPYNLLRLFDAKSDQEKKVKAVNNFKKILIEKFRQELHKQKSNDDWKKYSYNFIKDKKFKFAYQKLKEYLDNQEKYNKKVFLDLVKLWWRYSTIAGTLAFFKLPFGNDLTINIIEGNYNLPTNSFLYRVFKADEYIIDYSVNKNINPDKDSPNDNTYIALMKDFDILLTADSSFLGECFSYVYKLEQKEIFDMEEFIKEYS